MEGKGREGKGSSWMNDHPRRENQKRNKTETEKKRTGKGRCPVHIQRNRLNPPAHRPHHLLLLCLSRPRCGVGVAGHLFHFFEALKRQESCKSVLVGGFAGEKGERKRKGNWLTHLLMRMIIAALVRLELVDARVALLAELAVEGAAGFARGFGLFFGRGEMLVGGL